MSHADLINGANVPFHPASHYDSLGAVLSDTTLSAAEKRVILSSWASDMYAVDSNPSPREVPGTSQVAPERHSRGTSTA